MADRKENELTKANNFEYVRALDSNGNSIQISKSDLVSVLEGLMPTVSETKNGFIRKGSLCRFVLSDSQEYIKIRGISSCSLLISKNQGGLIFVSFYGYGKTLVEKIAGTPDTPMHYDKTNHILYIGGNRNAEYYIFDISQSLVISKTNEDPTSYDKIL